MVNISMSFLEVRIAYELTFKRAMPGKETILKAAQKTNWALGDDKFVALVETMRANKWSEGVCDGTWNTGVCGSWSGLDRNK